MALSRRDKARKESHKYALVNAGGHQLEAHVLRATPVWIDPAFPLWPEYRLCLRASNQLVVQQLHGSFECALKVLIFEYLR